MNRRRLMAVKCSLGAEGVCVYLDEYETREEAEEALHNAVIEHADYAIIEEVVADKRKNNKSEENYITTGEQKCRVCGCTWNTPCEGGCSWVEVDLCSKCAENLEIEEFKKMVDEAPDKCPITGLVKCESYTIGGNVVYLTNPAYDAYTLPVYDPDSQSFLRTHYDMDDDNREECEWLCDLDDLKGRPDFQEIKRFYGIA